MRLISRIVFIFLALIITLMNGPAYSLPIKLSDSISYNGGIWRPIHTSTIQLTNSFSKHQDLELYVDFLGDSEERFLLMGDDDIMSSMVFDTDYSEVTITRNGVATNTIDLYSDSSEFIFYLHDKVKPRDLFYSEFVSGSNLYFIGDKKNLGLNKGGFIVHDIAPISTPIVPTLFLFGSGLIGLAGICRRSY